MASLNDAMISDLYNNIKGNRPDQNTINSLMNSGYADSNDQLSSYIKNGGMGQNQAPDAIYNAQQALNFQKTANAPVAAALGSNIPGIKDQYTQLVNSIKGSQTVSQNSATLAANNELGQRGLLPNSSLYQNQMNQALLPVNSAYSGILAQANTGSIQDLNNLALQVAQLQAGDPNVALSNAYGLAGIQTSAAAQIAAAQAQAQGNISAAQAYNQYHVIPSGGQLYSVAGSQLIGKYNPQLTVGGGNNSSGNTTNNARTPLTTIFGDNSGISNNSGNLSTNYNYNNAYA